jgi:hypothetical protein
MASSPGYSPPPPTWKEWVQEGLFIVGFFLIWPWIFLSTLAKLPRLRRLRRAAFGTVYESRREGGQWVGRRCASRYPKWTFEERAVDPTAVVRAKRFTFFEGYGGYHQATEAPILELRLDGGEKLVLEAEPDGHALDDLMDDLRRRGVLDDRRPPQLSYPDFIQTLFVGGLWLVAILIASVVLRRSAR